MAGLFRFRFCPAAGLRRVFPDFGNAMLRAHCDEGIENAIIQWLICLFRRKAPFSHRDLLLHPHERADIPFYPSSTLRPTLR